MTNRPRVSAATLIRTGAPVRAGTCMRHCLSDAQWAELVSLLETDPLPLAGLWSDGEALHALWLESPDAPLISSVAVENKRVLALSPSRPAATIDERCLRDLWGIEAMHALDLRPWLDHGGWTHSAPLSSRPGPAPWPPEPPEFLWTEADQRAGALQWPLGPVTPVLDGPGQMRVTVLGERVHRIEPLLGYAHRGVASALRGKTVREASGLVERVDAGATVAHALAFAQAVESALGWGVGGNVRTLRLAMLALERVVMKLRRRADRVAVLELLTASQAAFGHRLMRGAIVPGGWGVSPNAFGLDLVRTALSRFSRLAADPELRRDVEQAERGFAVVRPEQEPMRPVPSGLHEGLGGAEASHGMLWHWLRLDGDRVVAWHALDPTPARLHDLGRDAVGQPIDRIEALIRSARLSVAGVDQ